MNIEIIRNTLYKEYLEVSEGRERYEHRHQKKNLTYVCTIFIIRHFTHIVKALGERRPM